MYHPHRSKRREQHEKNRWSLIFIGLCLALAFSVSPVEAQMHHTCEMGAVCDRDGDGFFRDQKRCFESCAVSDPDLVDCNEDIFSDNMSDNITL